MVIGQVIGECPWGDLIPETMEESGLGGRETALIQLSRAWAKSGHMVINFVPTKQAVRYEYKSGGGEYYIPNTEIIKHCAYFGLDVLVSWEQPRIFEEQEIIDSVHLKVIEMQVADIYTDEYLDTLVDFYAVLSGWAGNQIQDAHPYIAEEKFVIFPNGVDTDRYKSLDIRNKFSDSPKKFFYSSSPDRGLVHLLRAWPKIRDAFPDSILYVAYGVENWINTVKWSHNMQAEIALEIEEKINQEGIEYVGKIGQDKLAEIQSECTALLYPCDTSQPTETGCITIVEAGAAGAVVVATDCDCLGSEFATSAAMVNLPFNEDDYVELIKTVLTNEDFYKQKYEAGLDLAAERNWPEIAERWTSFFEKEILKKQQEKHAAIERIY